MKALAKQRGKDWQLSQIEAGKLLISPCKYCASYYPKKMGIDRVDNSIDYLPNNCVACCWGCNNAKREKSVSDFKKWITRAATKGGNGVSVVNNKNKLYSYKRRANNAKFTFTLTDDEFNALIGKPCYYCNETAYGVDRLDSNIGYELANCASCCGECNKAKLTLSVQDFEELIKKLYNNIANF